MPDALDVIGGSAGGLGDCAHAQALNEAAAKDRTQALATLADHSLPNLLGTGVAIPAARTACPAGVSGCTTGDFSG